MKWLDLSVTKNWHKFWSPQESGALGGIMMSSLLSIPFAGLIVNGHTVWAAIYFVVLIVVFIVGAVRAYKRLREIQRGKK